MKAVPFQVPPRLQKTLCIDCDQLADMQEDGHWSCRGCGLHSWHDRGSWAALQKKHPGAALVKGWHTLPFRDVLSTT